MDIPQASKSIFADKIQTTNRRLSVDRTTAANVDP
jgi:hypothetical protein